MLSVTVRKAKETCLKKKHAELHLDMYGAFVQQGNWSLLNQTIYKTQGISMCI